ncbi:hypothetical protein ACFFF5_04955 [Lederbergia wuyishanensis]|uniref:Membrane protein YkvI n=1 Tax=Lederbergia wuyishanensis TaxID=1347903 RepID=A0ABU0CZ64_9BACI|nr:hypothetical protein [Lederbergia wuyishanensis]MCJ8006067.1 hypothetical protein [Lederbergia wuyishanensis]MDQ0341436.1 putative membrane protein YkvI [Lederbergia wuyishanensis]
MKKWTGALQVAAVYVGTVIGAGFATGREIVEFFTQYRFWGFISILIAGYLFILLGTKIMLKAIDIQATSFEQFNEYLFGNILSKIMNAFTMIMLLGVCAVMLSGAEALFTEQLGFSNTVGSIVTIFLALFVMAVGVKGLFAVNTFVVPMLILFNFILLFKSIESYELVTSLFNIPEGNISIKAIIAAFSYAAFNLALAQAVLVPIAVEINMKAIVKLGGWIGGAILTIILISSHIILTSLPNPSLFDIPMAVIVKGAASSIYFIYLLIIFGEIFTSLIGNMYGLERQINRYVSLGSLWIHAGIIVLVFIISRVNYGELLGILYPFFGYVSLIFLFILWMKPISGNEKSG